MAQSFTVVVQDAPLRNLLHKVHQRSDNMQSIMQTIGEDVLARIKERFATSTDPAGNKWQPNTQVTYSLIAHRFGKSYINKDGEKAIHAGKSWIQKDGRINSRGADKLASKKPLIGETGDLRRQFYVSSTTNSVEIFNTMVYAAIHQFGGMAGRGRKVRIPARPFLPVFITGELYHSERVHIENLLNNYLSQDFS